MRVLFVNAVYDASRPSGARVHIEQLVRRLGELGCRMWVSENSPVKCARRLSGDWMARVRQLRAMDLLYVRVTGRPPLLPRYVRRFWRRLCLPKPIVWEVNAAPELHADDGGSQSSRWAEWELELRAQARDVCLAICNTDGLARFASDLGASRTVTIPLGADPLTFSPAVPPSPDIPRVADGLNVVWCGNSSIRWHDFQTLAGAARALSENSAIRFYLIGEPPVGVELPINVSVLGPRPYERMPAYLSAMDVGLAIYRDPSWSRYGVFSSPLKLFDYMAAGLVPVSSPIEQARKCIEEGRNGFLVPFGDKDALAAKLEDIWRRKAQLKALQALARQTVTGYYNWDRVAEQTLRAMQQVASGRA